MPLFEPRVFANFSHHLEVLSGCQIGVSGQLPFAFVRLFKSWGGRIRWMKQLLAGYDFLVAVATNCTRLYLGQICMIVRKKLQLNISR
jgi:hypothetical protein